MTCRGFLFNNLVLRDGPPLRNHELLQLIASLAGLASKTEKHTVEEQEDLQGKRVRVLQLFFLGSCFCESP
jgi:hypothetical protein